MTKTTKRISSKRLSETIQTLVKLAILREGTHFTAMRNIEHMAASTSMDFEKTITDALGLVNPDDMQPEIQEKYYEVVTRMKDQIRKAALEAAKDLISFPHRED